MCCERNNRLDQLKSGKKYWAGGTPVAGQQFEYGFDDIGNRTATKAGGDENGANLRSASYTPNLLNQYTSRTVPGAVDIMGVSFATNAVTVNGQAAYRKGEYFRKELPIANTSGPVWTNITVSATGQGSTNGYAFLPRTPEQFWYDTDGNLTNDGRWKYTWDAENRLVRMISGTTTGPQQRLDFGYDSQGRRITRKVWNNTAGSGTPALDERFVYDGWNLAAELNATNNAVVRGYVWGLDLSGSMQGAGGVGGLLAVADPSNGTNFYCFDGNGNVSVLVSATNASTTAQYEYGPFGEVIRATGPMAKANPFRFSTKYQDDETDLLYYGYRYYNASTGRWLSRDPSEESDGPNIYAFLSNDGVSKADYLGLEWTIKRSRQSRATAVPCSESDTWDDLAIKMQFDVKDYQRWVQTRDNAPVPGKTYTVPNTVYIDFGKAAPWEFIPGHIMFQLRDFGHAQAWFYARQGYKVVLTRAPSGSDIMDHLSSRDIYAYFYSGHGDPGIGAINTAIFGNTEWVAPRRYTLYGIAKMGLYSCGSLVRIPHNGDNPGKFVQTPWERNVATRGWLEGFFDSIGGYDFMFYPLSWITAINGTNN